MQVKILGLFCRRQKYQGNTQINYSEETRQPLSTSKYNFQLFVLSTMSHSAFSTMSHSAFSAFFGINGVPKLRAWHSRSLRFNCE